MQLLLKLFSPSQQQQNFEFIFEGVETLNFWVIPTKYGIVLLLLNFLR
jgi:hypothetical protein